MARPTTHKGRPTPGCADRAQRDPAHHGAGRRGSVPYPVFTKG
ncbi:hypothetical protein [Streptomyces sp. NPDC005438]